MTDDLKTKYRPIKFKNFMGNEDTIDSLRLAIEKGKLPHSLLFVGPRGCGKTTMGRLLAHELDCNFEYDFTELDSAVFNGIDTVRELRSTIMYSPRKGPCKIYLIDEAHMLGQGGDSEKNKAQNAILKSLEEPPSHTYWILCTTDPQRILKTVRDRCTQFDFGPLDPETAFLYLKKISKKEKAVVPKSVLKQIVDFAEGRPRSMLSLLSKIVHLEDPGSMKRLMKKELAVLDDARILTRALLKGSKKGGRWGDVAEILKGLQNIDPEKIRRSVMGYCNTVLLNGENDRASLILGWFAERPTYDAGFPLITQFCYNIVKGEAPPL